MRTPIFYKSIAIIALIIAPLLLTSLPAAAQSQSQGFKWEYKYTASTNTGVLTVIIVEEAKQTVYTYPSNCVQQSDHIACDVDIQAAVNNSLSTSGMQETAPTEMTYPEIFAEVTGKIHDRGIDAVLVSHPSLLVHLATSKNGAKAEFSTDWSGVEAESGYIRYRRGKAHKMTTAFEPSRFEHFVNERPKHAHGASAAELPFRLSGTTFEIYQPSGFTLIEFIVDPGKPGFG